MLTVLNLKRRVICLDPGDGDLNASIPVAVGGPSLLDVHKLGPFYRTYNGKAVRLGYRHGDCSLRGRIHNCSAKRGRASLSNLSSGTLTTVGL